MSFEEYQKQCLTTMLVPAKDAVIYCALGLVGEVAELLEKIHASDDELKKELGDVEWYVPVLAHFGGVLPGPTWDAEAEQCAPSLGSGHVIVTDMLMAAGLIANKAKKVIRDGGEIDPAFLRKQLLTIAGLSARFSGVVLRTRIEDVRRMNITKLKDRHARGKIGGSGDSR